MQCVHLKLIVRKYFGESRGCFIVVVVAVLFFFIAKISEGKSEKPAEVSASKNKNMFVHAISDYYILFLFSCTWLSLCFLVHSPVLLLNLRQNNEIKESLNAVLSLSPFQARIGE
jgi:hypothetical protein